MAPSAAKRVCLVTAGHLTSTPRLLREASALVSAGYRIHLVSVDNYPPNSPLDRAILAETGWAGTQLTRAPRPFALAQKLLHRFARRLPACLRPSALLARAQSADSAGLARAAAAIPADYYIGHCLAALPAVARAARQRNVPFGFDLEDYHETETVAVENNPHQRNIVRQILRQHLPAARHLTAAAPLIAEAIERDYAVKTIVTLNVFPLDQAPAQPIDPGPVSRQRPARVYWFSQTVGPNRGLEEIIPILARLDTPCELQLRGHIDPEFAACLTALATSAGLHRPIRFLEFAPSREMVRSAAGADLGLALEASPPGNRDLCLTNKVFVYLLAGIPQLMTPTRAQAKLASALGRAALLVDLSAPDRTAAQVDAFFADPDRERLARRDAWQLGQTRYHWEREQEFFLRAVHATTGGPAPS